MECRRQECKGGQFYYIKLNLSLWMQFNIVPVHLLSGHFPPLMLLDSLRPSSSSLPCYTRLQHCESLARQRIIATHTNTSEEQIDKDLAFYSNKILCKGTITEEKASRIMLQFPKTGWQGNPIHHSAHIFFLNGQMHFYSKLNQFTY